MSDDGELYLTQNSHDDGNALARMVGNSWNHWLVDCYDDNIAQVMLNAGCEEVPSHIEGTVFRMTAQQLILFIAEQSGVIVQFRQRKPKIVTEETRQKYRENLERARLKIGK